MSFGRNLYRDVQIIAPNPVLNFLIHISLQLNWIMIHMPMNVAVDLLQKSELRVHLSSLKNAFAVFLFTSLILPCLSKDEMQLLQHHIEF